MHVPEDYQEAKWEILVESLQIDRSVMTVPCSRLQCMCYVKRLRECLIFLMKNNQHVQFELTFMVLRDDEGISKVTFRTLMGFVNWTVFQLGLSVPSTLKELAEKSEYLKTKLREKFNAVHKKCRLTDDYVTKLIIYWKQHQFPNEPCWVKGDCLFQHRPDELCVRGVSATPTKILNLILLNVEAVSYAASEGWFLPNMWKDSVLYCYKYRPQQQTSILGEAMVMYPKDTASPPGSILFALKNFWQKSLDGSLTPVRNASSANYIHLTSWRSNLIVEKYFIKNQNQSQISTLKEQTERMICLHISRNILQHNIVRIKFVSSAFSPPLGKLCTCFAKNVFDKLKNLTGSRLARQITEKILERVALSSMIKRSRTIHRNQLLKILDCFISEI